MKIRIAQQGWGHDGPAKSLEEVRAGVKLPWIELDGHRLSDIASVEFRAATTEFGMATMTVELLGPVEIVYIGADGQPLGEPVPMTAAQAIAAGRIDYGAIVERPEASDG